MKNNHLRTHNYVFLLNRMSQSCLNDMATAH
jgi:hypothetical protein